MSKDGLNFEFLSDSRYKLLKKMGLELSLKPYRARYDVFLSSRYTPFKHEVGSICDGTSEITVYNPSDSIYTLLAQSQFLALLESLKNQQGVTVDSDNGAYVAKSQELRQIMSTVQEKVSRLTEPKYAKLEDYVMSDEPLVMQARAKIQEEDPQLGFSPFYDHSMNFRITAKCLSLLKYKLERNEGNADVYVHGCKSHMANLKDIPEVCDTEILDKASGSVSIYPNLYPTPSNPQEFLEKVIFVENMHNNHIPLNERPLASISQIVNHLESISSQIYENIKAIQGNTQKHV